MNSSVNRSLGEMDEDSEYLLSLSSKDLAAQTSSASCSLLRILRRDEGRIVHFCASLAWKLL